MWVYQAKTNVYEHIERYKERLLAKVFLRNRVSTSQMLTHL